ncbi:MAG: glucosyltransferase domain-containing protein [Patescibacteria group bacterium]
MSPVVSHDEIYYLAEAKTIALDGLDLTGQVSPLSLQAANPLYAELPGLMMVPGALLFPNNPLLAGRFTHAVLGSAFALVLAGVVLQLFHSRKLALVTATVCLFNPWWFENSRMSFDSLLSLFFYFSAIWVGLSSQKKMLPLSFLLFVLGFYQYQGLKILFLPMIFMMVLYQMKVFEERPVQWLKLVKKNYVYLVFFIIAILFFGIHLFRLSQTEAGGRVNDLIFLNHDFIETRMNKERAQGLVSPLNKILNNKATVLFEIFSEKYLNSFEFSQLFLHVDALRNPFAVWSKGIFHLVDLPLILVGIAVLFSQKKWRSQAIFITTMVLIAPLPSAINSKDTWMFFRASFLFPWGILLSAMGLWKMWQVLKPRWLIAGVAGIYMIFIVMFFYDYFVRYPVYGTNQGYLAERVLSRYVKEESAVGKQVYVYAEEPYFTFTTYLTLANVIQKNSLDQIHQAYQSKVFAVNAVQVIGECFSPTKLGEHVAIVDARIPFCEGESEAMTNPSARIMIPSLIDSGSVYKIYNDSICQQYGLPPFSHVTKDVFQIESLPQDTFCKSFFAVMR